VGKHEIRHSNFLAWLLNPNESHGIGDLFLTQFLRDIVLDEKCGEIKTFAEIGISEFIFQNDFS
jgi:hypothetical protein